MKPTPLFEYLKLGMRAEYLRGISSVSIARSPELPKFPALVENDPARRYAVVGVTEALAGLLTQIDQLGMRKTQGVAAPLPAMLAEMQQALKESQLGPELFLRDPWANQFVEILKGLGAVLEVEVGERQTIDIDRDAAGSKLGQLPLLLSQAGIELQQEEMALWGEAVQALALHLPRAALLAGWEGGLRVMWRQLVDDKDFQLWLEEILPKVPGGKELFTDLDTYQRRPELLHNLALLDLWSEDKLIGARGRVQRVIQLRNEVAVLLADPASSVGAARALLEKIAAEMTAKE